MKMPSTAITRDDRPVDRALRGFGLRRHCRTQAREAMNCTTVMTRITTVMTTAIDARIADLEGVERLLDDQDRHRAGGVARTALGQDDDQFEHLQRADRGIDDREEHDRRDPGQGDAEEAAPVATRRP